MSARRLKLPPLVRYQVDMDLAYDEAVGGKRWRSPGHGYPTLALAKYMTTCTILPAIVRRLSDGKIVWRNKAAKEAGL